MLISQTSQAARDYRILETAYGNGYKQRAGDGINNIQDQWTVQYDNLTSSQYGTLLTAIDAAYGVNYFIWTPPNESSAKKWIVSQVTRQIKAGFIYSVKLTLTQVFDL